MTLPNADRAADALEVGTQEGLLTVPPHPVCASAKKRTGSHPATCNTHPARVPLFDNCGGRSLIGGFGHSSLHEHGVRVLAIASVILFATTSAVWAFTDTQARSGENIYKHQCARCHGDRGEGKDDSFRGLRAPELIGPSALPCKPRPFQKIRQHDFRTVKDVYDYVSALMPADQPASLESAQYWSVLAYTLQANGKTADGVRLDATSSAQMILHPDCPAAAAQKAPP